MPHHYFIPEVPSVDIKVIAPAILEKQKIEDEYRPFKPLNIRELVLQAVPIKFEESLYNEEDTSADELTELIVEKIDKIVEDMINNMRFMDLYQEILQETYHHLETINYLHNIIIEMCKDSDKYYSLFSHDDNLISYFNVIRREQQKRLTYCVNLQPKLVLNKFSSYLITKANEYHKNTIYKYTLMIHYGMNIPNIDKYWLRASIVLVDLLKPDLEKLGPIEKSSNINEFNGFNGVYTEMILERAFTLFAVSGIHLQVQQQTSLKSEMNDIKEQPKIYISDDRYDDFKLDATAAIHLAAAFCRSIGLMKESQRGLWVNLV